MKTYDRFPTWRRPEGVLRLVSAAVLLFAPFMATLAFGVLSPAAVAAQERGDLGIALGERPELVEIEDLEGNKVSLAEYIGESPALIEFWARWCGLCDALHPQLVDTHARYGDRVQFVAVAVAVAQSHE